MTITIPSDTLLSYGTARVYTRTSWTDEWVEVPGLHPLETVWCCAPTMPTATLIWHYGRVWLNDEAAWQAVAKLDLARKFIKIEIDTQPDGLGGWNVRSWFGRAEFCEDQAGGLWDGVHVQGTQKWTVYGMESLLADFEVRSSVCDLNFAGLQFIGHALPFNPRIRGRVTGNQSSDSSLFVAGTDTPEFWDSLSIVQYLCTYQTPPDETGAIVVPFALAAAAEAKIPSWDRPELEAAGKTTYSLLNQILDRRRLVVWWLAEDTDTLEVQVATLTAAAIELPLPGDPVPTIPANTAEDLLYDESPFTTAVVRYPAVPVCDQVRARGARRILVGSFSFPDGTQEIGWTSTLETAYEQAASGQLGYGSLKPAERERRNIQARTAPQLQAVYAYFQIPEDWDGLVGDGEGLATKKPLFWRDIDVAAGDFPDADAVADFNRPNLTIRETLPLLEGVDYGGDKLIEQTYDETVGSGRELEPLVFLRQPGTGSGNAPPADVPRWIRADVAGRQGELEHTSLKDDHRLTCQVRVAPDSQGIYVHVTGAPQHALAKTDFTPLPADKISGSYDYKTGMICTLAILDDRHVEGVWPADADVVSNDAVRIKYIDAGEIYRETYVAPNTVVDVDANGELIRSDGGFLPKHDDDHARPQLQAVAKIAQAWYGQPHYVLTLESFWLAPTTQIYLGKMIGNIGTAGTPHRQTINSVITEIKISWPWPEHSARPEPPKMTFTTWAGELDAYQATLRPLRTPMEVNNDMLRATFGPRT